MPAGFSVINGTTVKEIPFRKPEKARFYISQTNHNFPVMKRITVFCGSNPGNNEGFYKAAFQLGKMLAERNIGLVFGGGKIGLMGAVADGALTAGGEVIGVIPEFLRTKEVAHTGLTNLIQVGSMHERKATMNDLCDGVIALPGGYGTMEELFEMLTWAQLGLHRKPVALLNVAGFYEGLLTLFSNMVETAFLSDRHQQMLISGTTAEEVLEKMRDYKAPPTPKWISPGKT